MVCCIFSSRKYDLSLLEPLAEILELSLTELITGEIEVLDENKETVEHAVKETIEYGIKKERLFCRSFLILSFLSMIYRFSFLLTRRVQAW